MVSDGDLVVDLELGPVERQLGVAYVHDIDLAAGRTLAAGDRLVVRDEGGNLRAATVERIVPLRFGVKYRLQLGPEAGSRPE